MPYSLPSDADERPIAIAGAGTLGRRIATVYAVGGSEVRIFDQSPDQRQAAVDFFTEQSEDFRQGLGLDPSQAGSLVPSEDLESAVDGAWMVIEAVPEKLELKQEVFGELDDLALPDAILASNSSSLPTSQMISDVTHPERVLNTHYYMPPGLNAVELMSCGKTDEAIIEALMAKFPQYGLVPFHVRRESDGFIFNRIWAAIKRECLMVVDEGVASPTDVDHGSSRPRCRARHRGALRCDPYRDPRRPAQTATGIHRSRPPRRQDRRRIPRPQRIAPPRG
jgi:3-hydroxybutyryl-CoA dehydrogenase